ncbi:MAG: hypothetical protein IT299_03990 [Dehalococcoidia bacterium]|nr:hypothetical protein [Dehalococcoidia bacterium]
MLAATSASTTQPAGTTEAVPTAVVEVALEVTPEPFAFAMGVDPLLEFEPARAFIEVARDEPVVYVEARTVAAVPPPSGDAPWSAPVAPRNVVPPSEIPPQPVSSARLTRDEIYALTQEMSGDAEWAVWATRVIMCESGGQVNAVSPDGHYGLAQVSPIHGYDLSRMLSEPRFAVQAMINIYQSSGPRAWSCK